MAGTSERKARHIRRVLIGGFSLVLALSAFNVQVGLSNMNAIQAQLDRIVLDHNVKKDLVTTMREAARERTVNLYRMITLADPFARDEEFLRFNANGTAFAEARIRLKGMPLDTHEKALLEHQGAETRRTVELQRKVADLALGDRLGEASALLYDKTVPGQRRVFAHLTRLQNYQTAAIRASEQRADDSLSQARRLMFGAGAGVLILGALIALWVLRNTSRTELLLLLEKSSSVATLRSLGEGVIRTDVRGRISYINSVASSLTGRTLREANGRRLPDVFKLLDAGGRRLHDNPALIAIDQDRGIESSGQLTLESSTGDQSPIEYTVTPIRDQAHRASGAVLVFRNLTEIRRMANQLAYQATHDPLTGLVNRYEFERRMEAALDSARDQKRRHTLLYLDLDQFQVINNISGHLAGDELLKRIAARLHDNTCKTDTLARLGGDEFGVLLIDCAPGEALPIAHALRREVTGLKFSWDGKPFDISVSIGMVEVSSRSGSSAELLSAADNACYLAKDLGRNRIQLYKLDDAAVLRRQGEMRWLPRIRAALEHDHFRLFHQRIVSLAPSFHEQHCEILLRLVDGGDEKVVLPGAFIPAAERYNLMHEIDRWVITEAFQFLASHPDYLSDPRQLWTINLSGQTICDAEFLSFVVSRFREHAIPPDRICFEITETTAVRNLTQASELMRALRAMGCRFALDDFGSGLSSFNYLKHLKADFLKIDGSFIRDMLTDSTDCAMVESINQIGQLMGLRTIAEFVENEDILLRLRALRVDFAQGTGVHMPQPLAAWRHRDAMPA